MCFGTVIAKRTAHTKFLSKKGREVNSTVMCNVTSPYSVGEGDLLFIYFCLFIYVFIYYYYFIYLFVYFIIILLLYFYYYYDDDYYLFIYFILFT